MNNYILYKITTSTCQPCRMLKPHWNKVKENNKNQNLKFEEIVVDGDGPLDVVTRHNVKSVPTILLIDSDGNLIDKHTGFILEKDLISFIKKHIQYD